MRHSCHVHFIPRVAPSAERRAGTVGRHRPLGRFHAPRRLGTRGSLRSQGGAAKRGRLFGARFGRDRHPAIAHKAGKVGPLGAGRRYDDDRIRRDD